MADFAQICKNNFSLLEQFKIDKKAAADAAAHNNLAVNKIQKIFRGTRSRYRIYRYNVAALEIERVFRGNVGRRCCRAERKKFHDYKTRAKYNYFVIYIQRCFRGYYSRKYKQNYAERKKYVESVVNTAAAVREKTAQYLAEQTDRLRAEQEQAANDEFISLAQNLHHLVGTQQIRGIYNPSPKYMNEPTAQAVPIEDHLRGIVKDLLRSTGRNTHKGGLVADVNGTKKIPYKGTLNKLSIQASAPYDTMTQEARRSKVLHKMLRTDKNKDFLTCTKPTQLQPKPGDPNEFIDPFLDKWANPFFVKGVPRDEAQLRESVIQRKALFALPTDRAHNWYNGTKGNKSTAYPNDLFDVIGDATMTGGTARRQIGKTQRFGLPDSADNRGLPTSVLPAPPLRDTSVLYGTAGIHHHTVSNAFNVSAGMSTRKQQETSQQQQGSQPQSVAQQTSTLVSQSPSVAGTVSFADNTIPSPIDMEVGMKGSVLASNVGSAAPSMASPSIGMSPMSASRVAFSRSPSFKRGKSGTMLVKVRGLLPLSPMASPTTSLDKDGESSADED